MKMKNRHNINFNFTTIMKRVLFSVILLLAAGFTFAQEKTVKEAKSIANEVNPDFNKAEQLINQALTNPQTKHNDVCLYAVLQNISPKPDDCKTPAFQNSQPP